MLKEKIITMLLNEAKKGANNRDGGPFAACIIKQDQVIAISHNTVLIDNNPIAHAEINAITSASKKLQNYDLSTCSLFCTSEPCPMCMGAILWAKIKKLYWLADRELAQKYGFNDSIYYENLCHSKQPKNLFNNKNNNHLDILEKTFIEWQKSGAPIY